MHEFSLQIPICPLEVLVAIPGVRNIEDTFGVQWCGRPSRFYKEVAGVLHSHFFFRDFKHRGQSRINSLFARHGVFMGLELMIAYIWLKISFSVGSLFLFGRAV
jgi:hypothetical protein